MKHLSSWRAAVLLFAPLLLLAALVLGPARISLGQATGSVGVVVVGFTGTLPPGFQNISFNVVSVRLNPSTNPNVSDLDPNWVTIPVPQGVGLNTTGVTNPFTTLATLFNLNTTGQSPTAGGTGPSELQIDMAQIATLPQMFNSWTVPASNYHQIELALDNLSAGNVIPDCFSTKRPLEGCISSQIAMFNPSPLLRTSGQVTVPLGGVATLIIHINPTANNKSTPPSFSGANYTLNPRITQASSATGLIRGSASGATQVLAELSGTDQVVETTTLGGGRYTLVLPAATDGTLYDLVASSPNFAYKVASGVLVTRGQSQKINLDSAGFVGGSSLSGQITDQCSGLPIEGATVELKDLTTGVVLASANTDDTGTYPMRPSNFVPQAFKSIPNGTYRLVVSAAGYNTQQSSITLAGNSVVNVALGRAQLSGFVTVNPPLPAGSSALNVLVTAEDQGTHHIENVTLATIPPGSGQASFSMFVPDSSKVAAFDLYAAASDLFSGLPEKYTGHTIAVRSGVANSGTCSANPLHPTLAMQCVGHASVTGTTATFDSGTSIVLSKNGVQLITSGVVPEGTPNPSASPTPIAGRFEFCAPADPQPYTLQRFETSPPGAQPSPAASPTSVTMLPPTTVNPPCSTICSDGSGKCLVCQNQPNVEVP